MSPGGDRNPSFDCLVQGHITAEMKTAEGEVYGWWCTWCGTGAFNPEKHRWGTKKD